MLSFFSRDVKGSDVEVGVRIDDALVHFDGNCTSRSSDMTALKSLCPHLGKAFLDHVPGGHSENSFTGIEYEEGAAPKELACVGLKNPEDWCGNRRNELILGAAEAASNDSASLFGQFWRRIGAERELHTYPQRAALHLRFI
jgi:hypothetical protein